MMLTGGWEVVRASVRKRVGTAAYQAWFSSLDGSIEDGALVLQCPDRFSRDWIESRHGDVLHEVACAVDESIDRVDYRVRESAAVSSRTAPLRSHEVAETAPRSAPSPLRAAISEPVSARFEEPSFDSFIAGPGNVLALEAARAIASGNGGHCTPLVLIGGTGVGKSHLCRAIHRELHQQAAFLSSEEFTSEVTQAIRSDRMPGVRHRYRRALNVLILEDVQFLRGKRATQVELFHTLDHLISRGRTIVLTSDRSPHELEGFDARLTSRMASGLVACISPPEYETRRSILREKAAAGGVHVPDDVLDVLAEREIQSSRDLIAGLNQVVARSTLLKRPVSLDLAREALLAVEVPGQPRSIAEIVQAVARGTGVSIQDLEGRSRRRSIVRPRQMAMLLCRRFTSASLAEIGHAFGRDHSSVIYALARVEKRAVEEPQLRYQLESLALRFAPAGVNAARG